MMQLIKITTTPIEYQYQVERPRLEVKQADNPQVKIDQTTVQLGLKQRNTQVRIDTMAMRSSMGLKGMPEFMRQEGDKGMRHLQSLTGEWTQMASQLGRAQEGVTVASIMTQKMLQQPQTRTMFIPSVGPDISWEPAQLDIQYQEGILNTDWKTMQNIMDFVPGKFQMIIKQYPKVHIEYLGGPSYVPPSSAPGYEGD